MITFEIGKVVDNYVHLLSIGEYAQNQANIKKPFAISRQQYNESLLKLKTLHYLVSALDMPVSKTMVGNFIERYEQGVKNTDDGVLYHDGLCWQIAQVRHRLADVFPMELATKKFLVLREQAYGFFEDLEPFGPEVSRVFPIAIDDIEGAAKCLALGQGTACVMHLMRVMEAGLKALANRLKIPYAPSWESYLKQIQTKIAAKHKTKGVRWKRDEPFFTEVSGDLISIKQAWRNPSMHIVRKYSQEEAEDIFRAVRSLMQRLALKLEPGTDTAWLDL